MVGTRFGNYRSISLLGEGGMGAVYLAEHPEIGRRVAVKVLHTDLTRDPQLLTRFLNEARAANAIHHPNIIEILDSGTTDGGMPYLVMELLEGETLAARVRRLGKLSLAEALDIAYQTASAVGAAHRKNIVHRDLKPDNLFIIADHSNPGRERVKVLDFGIAKLQAKTAPGMMVQTRTGTVMGTPAYMSPEQCLGNRELDARSDIYSLGIILYEMLCGRTPYVSTGFGELLDMHLHAPFPPPRHVRDRGAGGRRDHHPGGAGQAAGGAHPDHGRPAGGAEGGGRRQAGGRLVARLRWSHDAAGKRGAAFADAPGATGGHHLHHRCGRARGRGRAARVGDDAGWLSALVLGGGAGTVLLFRGCARARRRRRRHRHRRTSRRPLRPPNQRRCPRLPRRHRRPLRRRRPPPPRRRPPWNWCWRAGRRRPG